MWFDCFNVVEEFDNKGFMFFGFFGFFCSCVGVFCCDYYVVSIYVVFVMCLFMGYLGFIYLFMLRLLNVNDRWWLSFLFYSILINIFGGVFVGIDVGG